MTSALEELEQATREVAATAGPSVVGIAGGASQGSGVVVATGQVLTNAHHAWGPEVRVTFADGRVERAAPAGVDVDGDLAVLSVDTGSAPPIDWAEAVPGTGAVVWTVANPGGRGLRTTFGMVSAAQQAFRGPRGRPITGSLEHSAPLARGSSGSPVLDREGRLVGLNTHRLGDGFYLALPADDLRARAEALGRGEAPVRRRLGLGLAPPAVARRLRASVGLDERDGLLVRTVDERGPAARAGVRPGDLVVAAGGTATTSVDALHEALGALEEEASLSLRVVRGAEELDVVVAFGPDAARNEGAA